MDTFPDMPLAPAVWPTSADDPEPAHNWTVMDRRLGMPNDAQIRRLAMRIEGIHHDQPDATERWRKLDYRIVGLYGERAFGRYFRLTMDTRLRKWGNNRANFKLADGTVVDVVTRQVLKNGTYPDLTRRKRGTPVRAKALVMLIWVGPSYEPAFCGWAWDADVVALGRTAEFYEGNPNWIYPLDLLQPMHTLMARHRPFDPLAREDSVVTPIMAQPVPAPIIQQGELF